jgi:hypothetical protein
MNDVPTAVITGFVSAFTMFLAVAAFTSRLIGTAKSEIKADINRLDTGINRLDEKFERLMFELLRHFREGGHPPPPQAA